MVDQQAANLYVETMNDQSALKKVMKRGMNNRYVGINWRRRAGKRGRHSAPLAEAGKADAYEAVKKRAYC